jgi:Na+-driven multidrug efflux pump
MTLGIALPIMLSNVSTPRLEAIDTAVVGQISDPGCIARTVTLLRYYPVPLRSGPR